MSVRFASGVTTVDLQNPHVQNAIALDKEQHVGRSVAGARYRYDRGPETKRLKLKWSELRESEKTELQSFFATTVDGVMTQFTYTDHRGAAWNAQFVEPLLEFVEVADASAGATTFTSDGDTYPTTTREAGVWSVEFELEVSAP